MSKQQNALRLALEALEGAEALLLSMGLTHLIVYGDAEKAITALREALQKEDLHKLAAESLTEGLRLDDWPKIGCVNHDCDKCKALAEQPAQRTWVGLTDEEVMVAAYQAGFDIHEDYENEDDPEAMHWWTPDGEACDDSLLKLRDLIEAKLKEKNNA